MAKRKREHGGNIKAAAEEYDLIYDEIIDFSANINFLGPPSIVKEVIEDSITKIVDYPEPDAKSLAVKLAGHLGIEPDDLIIGNGAVEIIYLISKVINPRQALVLAPTFSEYEAAIESVGGEVELFQLARSNNFKLDINQLIAKLQNSDIDMLFLCNPNNPTGDLIKRNDLIKVLEVSKQEDIFVVVDEAFLDFLTNEADYTLISEAIERNNLLVLRSMTKFFAIPGLRIGYGITNRKLVTKLNESKDPWNVNLFAQRVGSRVLEEQDYIRKTKEAVKQEKDFLYKELKGLPNLKPYLPTANYILIDIVDTKYTSWKLHNQLAQEGILIRDCSTYHLLGADFIRVAVKNREDNLRLIEELKSILD
ncbi:MAG: threonine-phosphate decarboxylase [Candidatus Frackibacter sp. T328-2]|nr:MAG: threonine-phosphate decarboxylase [Candidatus Frackibacter sp. T328-2]